MINFLVMQIQLGKITIEQVPLKYKEEVIKLLEKEV